MWPLLFLLLQGALTGRGSLVGNGVTSGIVSAPTTFTLWPNSTVPGFNTTDTGDYTLGVKVFFTTTGYVTAARFYKQSSNTGTHIGRLYTAAGIQLGSVTFSGETSSGWQNQNYSTQIPICAGTGSTYIYVLAYDDPNGQYAEDDNAFTSQYNNSANNMHAIAAVSGNNGVYNLSQAAFPASPGFANYSVDAVYLPSGSISAAYSVSPTSGATGASLVITGCGFTGSTTVSVGGNAATVTAQTATSLTVTLPSHAVGVVNVATTTGGLTSTLPSSFTYTSGASAPTVTAVNPNNGSNAGGTPVTLTGTNFISGATAAVGGSACTGLNVVNSTSITCTTPLGTAGATVNVTVTTSGGTGTCTSCFTYSSSGGGILFQDNFDGESNAFERWNGGLQGNSCNGEAVKGLIVATPPGHPGTNAAQINYSLPASSSGGRDCDVGMIETLSGVTNAYFRGYLRFGTPITGPEGPDAQRKIYYLKDGPANIWHAVLKNFGSYDLTYQSGPPADACYDSSIPDNKNYWNLYHFVANTWYYVEMHVILNTTASSCHNGTVQIWVKGPSDPSAVKVLDITNTNIRGQSTGTFGRFEIGQQLNIVGPSSMTEARWWDDFVISSSFVGP